MADDLTSQTYMTCDLCGDLVRFDKWGEHLQAHSSPAPPTEREEREGAVRRLKAFIRKHAPGGCFRLSVGDHCTCPLCDVERLRTHSPSEPCRIYEYDGAFRCHTHDRLWGAVTDPDEPCVDLEPEPPGNHWRTRPIGQPLDTEEEER